MTKKVIAIISVLKPVDDTRNYEKVARSISNTNKYEINIIGFSTKKNLSTSNINFYPIFNFKRASLSRLIAPFKMLKILLKLKPQLIIVTCPELLIVSVVYKILFGVKIIYDLQENYFLNFVYSGAYSPLLKYPIALFIRLLEMISSLFIDQFVVAERIYIKQIKFLPKSTVIIENKALITPNINVSSEIDGSTLSFVYSGTIAQHYGIFEAIEFVEKLHLRSIKVSLTIIGYASQIAILNKLLQKIENKKYIKLIGGDVLVPHDQILKEIEKTDFCLLPYHNNRSAEGRIPTKLFECLAMEKPVIISPNATLIPIINKNNAGIIYDFSTQEEIDIDMLTSNFYGNDLSTQYKWESISQKFLLTVDRVIS